MKIKSVKRNNYFFVETDEDEYCQYYRYGPDCWYVSMGESDEPVYYCEEIEQLFQDYKNREKDYECKRMF